MVQKNAHGSKTYRVSCDPFLFVGPSAWKDEANQLRADLVNWRVDVVPNVVEHEWQVKRQYHQFEKRLSTFEADLDNRFRAHEEAIGKQTAKGKKLVTDLQA